MEANKDIMKEIGSMLKAYPRGATAIEQKIRQLYELSINNLLTAPEENVKCTLIGECRAYRDVIEMLQFAQTVELESSQDSIPVMNPIRSPYDI